MNIETTDNSTMLDAYSSQPQHPHDAQHEEITYESSTEGLSESKEKALILLVFPSAILSIVGSSIIIYMAFQSRIRKGVVGIRSKRHKKWTPYTRLLLGMSIYDIVFTVHLSITSFLRPSDDDDSRVWAFGDEKTCNAMGFLDLVAHGSVFYNAFLSFYFLLSTRFQMKNHRISKFIEPVMHLIANLYPLATAIVGLIYDIYSPSTTELGCWAGSSSGDNNISAAVVGGVFYGVPYAFTYISLVVNNLIILFFVRRQTKPLRRKKETKKYKNVEDIDKSFLFFRTATAISTASFDVSCNSIVQHQHPHDVEDPSALNNDYGHDEAASTSRRKISKKHTTMSSDSDLSINDSGSSSESVADSDYEDDDTDDGGAVDQVSSNTASNHRNHQGFLTKDVAAKAEHTHNQDQLRRLQLVSSQAFLYVGSFFICVIWVAMMAMVESKNKTTHEEAEPEVDVLEKIFPLLVLNSIFAPLQGLFNLLVFIRPKYLKYRHKYPKESCWYVLKRSIFGDDIEPKNKPHSTPTPPQNHVPTVRINRVDDEDKEGDCESPMMPPSANPGNGTVLASLLPSMSRSTSSSMPGLDSMNTASVASRVKRSSFIDETSRAEEESEFNSSSSFIVLSQDPSSSEKPMATTTATATKVVQLPPRQQPPQQPIPSPMVSIGDRINKGQDLNELRPVFSMENSIKNQRWSSSSSSSLKTNSHHSSGTSSSPSNDNNPQMPIRTTEMDYTPIPPRRAPSETE